MILSDKSIEYHIMDETGDIGCDPLPTEEQIQPASLDVRLGNEFAELARGDEFKFEREKLTLKPGVRYLGHTKEIIDLPNDIAAQLAGRSSIGRRGVIVHKTAGWIDPGFKGQITLELMNLGDGEVVLEEGERIGQLVFSKLDQPSSGYEGGYQGQTGATTVYSE